MSPRSECQPPSDHRPRLRPGARADSFWLIASSLLLFSLVLIVGALARATAATAAGAGQSARKSSAAKSKTTLGAKKDDAQKKTEAEVVLRAVVTFRGLVSSSRSYTDDTPSEKAAHHKASKDLFFETVQVTARWKVNEVGGLELVSETHAVYGGGGANVSVSDTYTLTYWDTKNQARKQTVTDIMNASWTYTVEPLAIEWGAPVGLDLDLAEGQFAITHPENALALVTTHKPGTVLAHAAKVVNDSVEYEDRTISSDPAESRFSGPALWPPLGDPSVSDDEWEKRLAGTFKPYQGFVKSGSASRNYSGRFGSGPEEGTSEFTGTVSVSYVLSYSTTPPKYEMTIEPTAPKAYDAWLPVPAGKDNEALFGRGEPLIFIAMIKPKKDSPPAKDRDCRIEFHLTDVSRHKGLAGNYPKGKGVTEKADLRFAAQQPDSRVVVGKDPLYAYTNEKTVGAAVAVEATDAGAYGTIRAECQEHGLLAKYEPTGDLVVSIPRDDNHNHVADVWEKEKHPEDWDEDPEPADQKSKGDGITHYKEYRGFVALVGEKGQKKHVRTDPQKKEVFVLDETGTFNAALWKEASGITALRLNRDLIQGTESASEEIERIREQTANFWAGCEDCTKCPCPDPKGKREDKIVDFNSSESDPGGHKYVITLLKHEIDDDSGTLGTTKWVPKPPPEDRRTAVLVLFSKRIENKVRHGFINGVLQNAVTDWSGPGDTYAKHFRDAEIMDLEIVKKAWQVVVKGRQAAGNNGEAAEVMEFVRRFLQLTVIHEVGHAVGIDGHRNPKNGEEDDSGEKTCPMCYFVNYDNRHATIEVLLGNDKGLLLRNRSKFCQKCNRQIDVKDKE